MRSTNSSRRLRFSSVFRSLAWSDFFSDAGPIFAAGARPVPSLARRPPRPSAWPAIRPASDPAAIAPSPSPADTPQIPPSACVPDDEPLAPHAHCGSVVQKSSSPSQRSLQNSPPVPPTSPRTGRTLIETYGVNRPHRLSPSLLLPQSFASVISLHYYRKRSSGWWNRHINLVIALRRLHPTSTVAAKY
jgi:hypothetical protein